MAGEKIYVGQTALRFEIPVGEDLTGILDKKLKYKKPGSSTVHEVSASVLGDPTDGVLYYDVDSETFLDVAGKWTFWAYVTFSDGRKAPGNAVDIRVYEEGET